MRETRIRFYPNRTFGLVLYHIAKSRELQLDLCPRRSDGLPNITESFYDECFQHVALGHWDIQGPYAARKCTSSGMSPLHQYQIQHYRG
jgi:hypothetical protein